MMDTLDHTNALHHAQDRAAFLGDPIPETLKEGDGFVMPWIDIGAAFDNPRPVLDFVLPGFLAATVGGLVAPGGGSKSTLALEMSAAIAGSVAGANILGIDIKHSGPVTVLAAEDPAIALTSRLHDFGKHLSHDARDALREHLRVAPLLGKGFDIGKPWCQRVLEETMGGQRMVVIDTLTRFHSLDENAAGDAKIVMEVLERLATSTGCAVLFLHHVSKAAALGGLSDLQQAARGSSVFVDNARWLSFVSGMSEDEAAALGVEHERKKYLRWNISKQNYGAPIPDSWFARSEGGILLPDQEIQDLVRVFMPGRKKPSRAGKTKGGHRAI